jgi:hypothetical protein
MNRSLTIKLNPGQKPEPRVQEKWEKFYNAICLDLYEGIPFQVPGGVCDPST